MRIQVRLPKIQPDKFELPEICPHGDCFGDTFKPHGSQGETNSYDLSSADAQWREIQLPPNRARLPPFAGISP